MIDKTVLELVDRLVATSVRATKAETDLADLEEQYQQLEDALEVAKNRITDLEATVKSKDSTISFYYKENKKLEEELKKHDTDGTGST